MPDVFLPGVEMQCIGSFKLLFYLLRVQLSTEVQAAALDVINIVTTNQECVNDIAASEVLAGLLLVIPTLPKSTILILETLYALISNTKIVKELMQKGKSAQISNFFPVSFSINVILAYVLGLWQDK